ncbi:MAG: hypothetical protein IPJ45_05950 [Ignavibacteria bacterium]|nr:hypothetical protein [Ignavibacteria bacterium]
MPVGTCLSGSLDSSTVVTLIDRMPENNNPLSNKSDKGRRQNTFSAVYDDASIDERNFVKK